MNRGLTAALPYPGSKRRLVPIILKALPTHKLYVEPFAGGASIALARNVPQTTVLNDIDRGLARFYREFSCEKLHRCAAQIKDLCAFAKQSFPKLKNETANTCETVAARRFSVVSAGHGLKRKECKVRPLLPKKLQDPTSCAAYEGFFRRAKVLNDDGLKVARRYDAKDTLTYIDPPYHGDISREYVTTKKETVTPDQVCAFARAAKGKVLISLNDHPDVRRACRGLTVREIPVKYGMRRVTRGDPSAKELLIANFSLPPRIV